MNGDDDPPPRLFATAFWVALAAGLLFVLAGAAVGLVGPLWLARERPAAPTAAALTAGDVRGKGPAPNTRNP